MTEQKTAEAAQAEAPDFTPDIVLHTFPSGRQCLATTSQSVADCVGMRHGEILRMARAVYAPRYSDSTFLASNVEFVHGTGSRIRGAYFSHVGCGSFMYLAGRRTRKLGPAFEAAADTFRDAFHAAAKAVADASGFTSAPEAASKKAEPESDAELKAQALPIEEPPAEEKTEEAPAPEAKPDDKVEEAKSEAADESEDDKEARRKKIIKFLLDRENDVDAPWSKGKIAGDNFFERLHNLCAEMRGKIDSETRPETFRGAAALASSSGRPFHVSSRVAEVRELTCYLEYKGFEPKQAVSISIDTVYGWPTRPVGGSRPYRP